MSDDGTRPELADTAAGMKPPAWPAWPGVTRPAGWFLPAESSPATEDGDAEQPVPGEWYANGGQASDWYEEESGEEPASGEVWAAGEDWAAGEPESPVVGPTAALGGRPGGPGFSVPPGVVSGLSDHRSPWEQSQEVWMDSGIRWERPADEAADPWSGAEDYSAPRAFGGHSPTMPGAVMRGPTPPGPGFGGPLSAPTPADAPPAPHAPAFAATPPDAPPGPSAPPAFADAPPAPPSFAEAAAARSRGPYGQGSGYRQNAQAQRGYRYDEADAWPSQRLRYPELPERSRVRHGPRRRRKAVTVARIGVPAVVIVAVGAVAIMMLTGRTPTVLAERGNQTTPAKTAPAKAASGSAGSGMTMATFPGYPGEAARAPESVNAIASNGTTTVAVGTVDGDPAAWQRNSRGGWTLVTAPNRGDHGTRTLTSVTQGAGGWIAVGGSLSGTTPPPEVQTSTNGHTWRDVDGEHAFSSGGGSVSGAAAGPAGYIVVGKIHHNGRTFAADWWSTNLRDWIRGGNGGLDGRLASSEMLAAAATPGGFVAVGQHAGHPAAWMAGTGHDWMVMDLPLPAGSSSAALTQVTSRGDRLVALGEAVTAHGTVPFAAVSGDGGASWGETALSTSGASTATVTAITATSTGFVAAGQVGQNTVYWTTTDGTVWSAPKPAGNGIGRITGLAAAASGTVTGVATMSGHPVLVSLPAS